MNSDKIQRIDKLNFYIGEQCRLTERETKMLELFILDITEHLEKEKNPENLKEMFSGLELVENRLEGNEIGIEDESIAGEILKAISLTLNSLRKEYEYTINNKEEKITEVK